MNESAPKKTTAPEASNQVRMLMATAMIMSSDSDEIMDLLNAANSGKEVVYCDVLPTEITCDDGYNARTILETAGVKFHEVVPTDRLFQFIDLPEGWRKISTLHEFWSWLIDDKGRKRASIFYNSKLYIRQSTLRLQTRFMVVKDELKYREGKLAVANVTDGDKVIYSTEPVSLPPIDGSNHHNAIEAAKETASQWLDENYPDWRNPGAYWD